MTERARDEITNGILKAIRDAGAEASEREVNLLVEAVREQGQKPPLNGYRKANGEYAKKLNKWLEDGERLVKAHPDNFNFHFVFSPTPTAGESMPSLMHRAEERYDFFLAILVQMRRQCEWIIENKFGEHGHAGYQQERAATAARELMERHRLPLAYSSPTSTYRSVARLFYQAMMGEADGEDIERACEVVARGPAIVIATEN